MSELGASEHPVVRLIGAPTDINSSFECGAALGPPAIRAALWADRGNMACEDGQEIGVDICLEDAGDLPLLGENGHDDALISQAITAALNTGAMPLVLGGDHAVSVPVVAALAARYGPLNILHFDAHPDLYDDFNGNPRSHASPFARIMEAGYANRLVQVGIRTMNAHCRKQAARFGVEAVEMRNFSVEVVPLLEGPLFISLDLDGLDPAFVPGVAHPEPGGLTVRELLAVLNQQSARLVGADIVELNPTRDFGDVSAITAAKLVRELAALHARNR
jgi:arginase